MLLLKVGGNCIVLTKIKTMALCLFLAFRRYLVSAIFLKYSKEGSLSSSHVGIRNIPSDVWYNDAKHYQVQSELTQAYSEPLQASKLSTFKTSKIDLV